MFNCEWCGAEHHWTKLVDFGRYTIICKECECKWKENKERESSKNK